MKSILLRRMQLGGIIIITIVMALHEELEEPGELILHIQRHNMYRTCSLLSKIVLTMVTALHC